MNSVGFLALGVSAGMITGFIISKTRTPGNFSLWLVALLPVLSSGTAVFLIPHLAAANSVDLYAVGLLVSLMWQQTNVAIRSIDKPPPRLEPLLPLLPAAISFIVALVLTVSALVLAFQK